MSDKKNECPYFAIDLRQADSVIYSFTVTPHRSKQKVKKSKQDTLKSRRESKLDTHKIWVKTGCR